MGFVTDIFSGGGGDKYQDAAEEFANLERYIPDYQAQQRELDALLKANQLTPETYSSVDQGRSSLTDYRVDPRLKEAQMRALGGLEEVANEGGLTAIDRARLNDIARQEAAQERGARQAILQNAQARGVGGSGLSYAAQLANQQGSAGRRADRGFDVAAAAQQRALEAMMGAGQLGGQIRGQGFDEAARVAQAQDKINRFNAANQTDARRYGATVRNVAQEGNINRAFDVNAQKQRLSRMPFIDRMQIARGKSRQLENLGDMEEDRRKSGQQTAGGLIGLGSDILFGKRKDENA